TEQITAARSSANNFESEKAALKEKLRDCEKNIDALRLELAEKNRKIEIANSEIKISSERKQTHHERLIQMDEEMGSIRFQMESLENALKAAETEKTQIMLDLEKSESELSQKDAQTQAYIQDWQKLSE